MVDKYKEKIISIRERVKYLNIKQPVGVIGTGNPNDEEYNTAYNIGYILSSCGFKIICGGRGGIMEAACKGVYENNGTSIGLLPELGMENCNKFVSIPLTTGIGLSRNVLIVSSSLFLISIGGSYGTLSEISYGVQFEKKIFSFFPSNDLDKIETLSSIDDLLSKIENMLNEYE